MRRLRVLRPPGRRARGVRQVAPAGRSRFATAQGHEAALERPVVVEKLRWRRQMSVEEFTYLRGRTKRPVKVTLLSAQQAAAYYDPDKSRGAYRDARRLSRRPRRFHAPRDRRAAAARLRVHPDRRAAVRGAARRDDPRRLPPARQRSGQDARRVHRARQRDHRRPRRHHLRHPHLPRQPQEHVLRVRRLRPDRGSRSSRAPASIASCSNTTTSGRARSSRCATCPTTAWSCSAWSARRRRGWRSEDDLQARIAEAAAIVPLERLALSPQCGFASTHEGNRLSADDQRQKLELVARTARAVWEEKSLSG